MTIQLEWSDASKSVIYRQVTARWSLGEIRSMIDEFSQLCENHSQCVSLIIEIQSMKGRPLNLLSLARYAEEKLHRHIDNVVIVGGSTFIKALISAARNFAPKLSKRITFVDSIKEAEVLFESTVGAEVHIA